MECLEDRLVPATLFVNTHQDLASSSPGVLSLREAIATANQATTPDTIVLSSGTYTLSLGQLTITNSMTIQGQGYWLTAVDGANLSRLFQVNGVGLGNPLPQAARPAGIVLPPPGVNTPPSVTFANLSLEHGLGTQGGISGQVGGGAIQASSANLSLVGCQLSGNTGLNGGAINDSNGTVTLTGSLVSGNTAQNSGGGIATFGGKLVVNGDLVQFNSTQGNGGGIFTTGSVTLNGSEFYDNSAVVNGGGVIATFAVNMTNGKVINNSAANGGGIMATTVTLTGCTVSDNSALEYGGGIDGVALTLTNSILTGNSARDDGGALLATTATLTGCTVNGNQALQDGGGIATNTGTLNGCTMIDNTASQYGGAIYLFGIGGPSVAPTTLAFCTLSGNSAGINGGGLSGAFSGPLFFDWTAATFHACTVSGNTAKGGNGGGIACQNAVLTDSTVSGNSAASGVGGGIFDVSGLLVFDTIADNAANQGGGVFVEETYIQDTIIARNRLTSGGTAGPDVASAFNNYIDLGNNLIGVSAPGFTSGSDQLGTAAHPLDPGLTALGNHGGPTQTYALLAASPALGNGVNVALGTLKVSVSAQATTLTIANFWPIPPYEGPGMLLRIDSEVVLVTAVNGNTLTVKRGVAGTIATAHTSLTSVFIAADQRGVLRPAAGKVDIGAFD
jgi:predicted outer membrane repeat protein